MVIAVGVNAMSPASSSGASSNIKLDPSGKPLQTLSQGPCKHPGCQFGRTLDPSTGHVLDYCSKTCATADSARQQQVASSSSAAAAAVSLDPGI